MTRLPPPVIEFHYSFINTMAPETSFYYEDRKRYEGKASSDRRPAFISSLSVRPCGAQTQIVHHDV